MKTAKLKSAGISGKYWTSETEIKCTVSCKMGDTRLNNTMSKKDLGIVVDHKLNMSPTCDEVIKNVNTILGCIKRSIVSKSCEVLVPLYSTLVRPHLKY